MKKIISLLLSVILLSACIPVFADNYSDMMEKANSYLETNDYSKAIASYQLAQKLQPQNESAFLGEANIYIMLGDYFTAYGIINTALESNPVSPDAWHTKCLIDTLTDNISAFEQDIIFAEICESDLTSLYLPAALMYSSAHLYETAASYFMLCDFSTLDSEQREYFRRALVYSGNREEAENLGLVAAEIRNANFDTAFDSNNLRLVRTSFPSISAEDFEFPDEMWEALDTKKPANPIAEVASYIPDSEFTWLSLSPAGNSGILLADGAVICYHNGKYRIMYPSHIHGVDDVNGNLARVFSMRMQTLLSDEGVVYSPDGRYAAICNIKYTLINMQLVLDPIIIDLSTGEMILTATFGNKLFKEDPSGAVSTATFSSDGCYFYYMMYGNMAEHKSALYRYNLNTQQTELCYSGSDLNYYPRISEAKDGSFIIIRDEMQNNKSQGISQITCINESWTGKDYMFDLPMKYWYTNRLLSSYNSGNTLLFGRNQITGNYYSFQLIRPDEDLMGLNQYYALSKSSDKILTFTANEITSLFENFSTDASDEEKAKYRFDLPFQSILASAISPDGHYVMILSSSYGTEDNPTSTYHLNIVSLDDLTIKEVTGIDPSDILFGALGAKYPPVIEWNTDTLIIGTKDGIQAYQFQTE